jgi:hypothetical protein
MAASPPEADIDEKANIACFAVFARRKTARSRADDGVFRKSLEEQVLDQDFCANSYENDAADGFHSALEEMSESLADVDAEIGQDEGYQSYDYYCNDDGTGYKRKSYADRQGVDTGRDRQYKQDENIRRIRILFDGFDLQGLINHFSANRGQKSESDPMVIMCYVFSQGQTGQRADQGHERLKGTEENRHSQSVFDVQLPVRAAAYD